MGTNNRTEKVKDKNYGLILIVGICLILFAPFVLTLSARWGCFDFSDTGPIGDTIGGITAPIVGTLGAILVYLSFREQREANRAQSEALNNEIKRTEKQSQFEFLYRFYADEIKKFEFPEDYSLKKCFYDLNNFGFHQVTEKPNMPLKPIAKVLNSYILINVYFLDEIKKLDKSQKDVLIVLYLSLHQKINSSFNLPPKNSVRYKILKESQPKMIDMYNDWFDKIDELDTSSI